ncbi:MAG: hypothetical protein KBF48_11235 [Xanthomonadales bacterium]|nr:hypothetical protein [Xanthomonadales bacterium]
MTDITDAPIFYWHESPGNRFRVDVADFDEAAECAYCVPVYSAETVDRLRARVAELEAAKVEPVAWRGINDLGEVVTDWIDGPKPARLFDLCGNESGYASYQVAYTAPPAPRVDVDAISDDALSLAYSMIAEASFTRSSPVNDMRAALRAIFNKGE